jgi:molybdate transport system substrate-binding protein
MSLSILSTLALKGVFDRFKAPLGQAAGGELEFRFDATQAILKQLAAMGPKDAWPDLLVLTHEAMQQLHKAGRVPKVHVLGRSGVGVAVRAGAPRPKIGTLEEFKQAISSASSVAHSKVGASGLYFSGLIESVPLTIKKRIVVESGPVGRVVASGEAEIGVQQLCELAPVAGIDIVGPLPDPVQRMTGFAAGIPAKSANSQAAAAVIAELRSPRLRAGMTEGGIEPAP